jgi:hypothetical protein
MFSDEYDQITVNKPDRNQAQPLDRLRRFAECTSYRRAIGMDLNLFSCIEMIFDGYQHAAMNTDSDHVILKKTNKSHEIKMPESKSEPSQISASTKIEIA